MSKKLTSWAAVLWVFAGVQAAYCVDLAVPAGTVATKNAAESYGRFVVEGRLVVESGANLTFTAESNLDGVTTEGIRPEIIMNGGSFFLGNRMNMGTDKLPSNPGNYAYLTMNGGTFTCTGTFKFPDDAGGEHRIYLNDGTMHCGDIEQKHDRDAIIYVGAGILRLDEITGGDRDPQEWKVNGDLLPLPPYDDIVIEYIPAGPYTEVRAVEYAPTVQFESAESGGFESVSPAVLSVNLSKAPADTVTVSYAVTGGTAEGGGVDYTIAASPLVFYSGQTNKAINISIVDDGASEDDETIEVTLTGVSGDAELGQVVQHTYTIVDPRPKVSFSAGFSSGRESVTPAYIEVGVSWPIAEAVTVDYAVTGGTADGAGVDYTLLGDSTLTFDPCQTTGYINIHIVADPCEEDPETIELTLSNPSSNAILGDSAQHTFTILDGPALLEGAFFFRADSDTTARIGPHPDVMVCFGDGDNKLIFRRDKGYAPVWYTHQSGEQDLPIEINRSNCDNNVNPLSRVFIVETSPARAIVRWRYARDCSSVEVTGWVDEYFTVYPDGVCIRTIHDAEGTTLPQWQDPASVIIQRLKLEFGGVSPLPDFWQSVPDLSLSGSSVTDYNDAGFDETRRCYVLECKVNGSPSVLDFSLDTTGGEFICNPVIVVKGWGDAGVSMAIDGQTFRNYQVGYAEHMNGTDLVVWLCKQSAGSISVSISPRGGSTPITRAAPADFGYDFDADVPPLPMGSPDPGPFGAYYTHLKFNNRFDELWRVGDHTDVVVQFDDNAHRFVFWRGTNYGPHWATDASETPYCNWYGTQFVERRGSEWGLDGCCEPMQDWQCRYSHARIISSNPARAIVHWRYAPCDKHYDIPRDGPGDIWGDWADEYFTIYPDAISVRKVTAYSSRTGGADMESPHIEFHEAIPVTNPGTIPEDNIHWNALSATDYAGDKRDWAAQDVDGGAMTNLHEMAGKPIMLVRMKGSTVPVSIVEGTSVEHDPVDQHDCRPFNAYDDWPAWPEGDRSMGGWLWDEDPSTHCYRYFWTKYPSHCSILHLKWQDYEHQVDVKRTKIMLFGMYDAAQAANVNNLIPLARSWQYAPTLSIVSSGFSGGSYDKTERAYKILRTSEEATTLALTLHGSSSSPIVNPCFVIEDWYDKDNVALAIDGQNVEPGTDFRRGIEKTAEGICSLVVWIRKESTSPIDVSISQSFEIPADFDRDRDVDTVDLGIFASHWLDDIPAGYQALEGDLDNNDKVNFDDFAVFGSFWGNIQ